MLDRYSLFLVTVAVGLGMANALAANTDFSQQAKGSGPVSGLVPAQGSLPSGLSAIKAPVSANLKEAPPADMLRDNSAASSVSRPELAIELAPKSTSGSLQALSMPPDLQAANPKGLNALREASSLRGGSNQAYQGFRSEFAGQADGLVAQPK
jgi:hypothetical protein